MIAVAGKEEQDKTNGTLKPPESIEILSEADKEWDTVTQEALAVTQNATENNPPPKMLSGHFLKLQRLETVKILNADIHLHRPPNCTVKIFSFPLCYEFRNYSNARLRKKKSSPT